MENDNERDILVVVRTVLVSYLYHSVGDPECKLR